MDPVDASETAAPMPRHTGPYHRRSRRTKSAAGRPGHEVVGGSGQAGATANQERAADNGARSERLRGRVGGCHGREELLETGCEHVVIVACHHVPGATDVYRRSMGNEARHFGHAGVADDVGLAAAHD